MTPIIKILNKMLKSSGSTYVKYSDLKKKCSYEQVLEALKSGEIVKRVRNENSFFTLPYIAGMEHSIAVNTVKHVHANNILPDLSSEEINKLVNEYEAQETLKLGYKFALHEEQRNAVHMAVNSHMCIITGGPGTGKTSVINAIRYVEINRPKKTEPFIIFTAPTGKAARRITESVGVLSKTVQKQIEANDYEDIPSVVSAYLMIVDEISMLDTVTMYQLMRSLETSTKLILVGDVDQLPSVGIGSILRDLIDSGAVPVTKLEKAFRQGAENCLAKNISYLRKGYSKLEQGDGFVVISDYDENTIVETLLNSTMDAYKRFGKENVILLTPYRRKGSTCANAMNKLLQAKLNLRTAAVSTTLVEEDEETGNEYLLDVCFKVGDPVMQLKNRDDCPIANGDVGFVEQLYTDNSIYVNFGHYTKIYEEKELSELNLAYAMSVHKSQGSEYKCVVTCALPEHKQLLNRNMVYTAITRAKKEVVFFCKEDVLSSALTIEGGYIRDTFLCEEIQWQEKKYRLIESAYIEN